MWIVLFIIQHVYWYSRVTLSSMFAGESLYVSFSRPSLFCVHFFTFDFRVRDERHSLRGFGSLSFLSLYSFFMWLSLCILIWVDHHSSLCVHCFTIILTIALDSSPSFQLLFFSLQWPILGLILSFHHPYTSLYQFDLLHCLIIDIIFTLCTFKFMAHEIFCTWGYGFWSLGIWA